ncbi:MAG: hypothetical protein ACM3ZC_09455 [Bacteroidota bacterium]
MLKLLGMAIALGVAVYTMSYAGQVWRERNRLGAAAVAALGLAVAALPMYILYFKP